MELSQPAGVPRALGILAAASTATSDPTPPTWTDLDVQWQTASLRSLHVGMGWHDEQPGGLNRMVMNLLLHLPAVDVAAQGLVAGRPEVERLSEGRARPFAQLSNPLPWRVLQAGRALRAAVRTLSPDVVALHFPLFGLLGVDGLRATPLVVHFHGPWAGEGVVEGGSTRSAAAKHWVEQRSYRRGTRFITLSHAFATVLEQTYGVDPSLVRVVPGGVDLGRFEPALSRTEARVMAGLPLDRPLVLAVRRLARRMGLQDLVSAFGTVRQCIPDAMLVIAGGGPLFDSLTAQIAEAGLENSVRLLGRVPDALLPALYRAADLSVVPSTALEGFGLTSVESLASGTPALVAPVGGLPEVVGDLAAELILPDTGVAALADGITTALLGTRPLPSPEACIAYVRRRYAWPIVAAQVRAVYAEAVA